MKHLFALAVLLPLASCSGENAPDPAATDRAVAQVEATNKSLPPLRPIRPEPITFIEMQKFAIHGKGCSFVRNGGGMAADAIMLTDRAVVVIDGGAAVFAADKGSANLPLGAWSKYLGKGLSLALTPLKADTGARPATNEFHAKLIISDPYGRAAFEAEGDAQCRPM